MKQYYVQITSYAMGSLLAAATSGPIIAPWSSKNEDYANLLLKAFPGQTTKTPPTLKEGKSLNCSYTEWPYELRHKNHYMNQWLRHWLHVGGFFIITYNDQNIFMGMTWKGFKVIVNEQRLDTSQLSETVADKIDAPSHSHHPSMTLQHKNS